MDSRQELPQSIECEKVVLGSVLLDNTLYDDAARLKPDAFSLDAHRRIWQRERLPSAGGSR